MYKSKILSAFTMLLMANIFCTCDNYTTLSSVTITPANSSVAVGATQQFTATGIFSDGTTKDISSSVTWTSGTTSVATISTSGFATGVATGTAVITATIHTRLWTTNLTVGTFVSDVYVSGSYSDGSNYIAAVWKNGVKTDFPGGNGSGANSVYASGGSIYVAGYYGNTDDNGIAAIWISSDGGSSFVKKDLPDQGTEDASASSIYVNGNNVYVAGYYTDDSVPIAAVWISSNGGSSFVKKDLPDQGDADAGADSIYVSGSNVYVAGYYFDGVSTYVAVVWVSSNGGGSFVEQDLPDQGDGSAEAYSVYASGNSVYVAGDYNNGSYMSAVWISSNSGSSFIKKDIPETNVHADSVYVSGGSIYVAGYYIAGPKPTATVWVSLDGGTTFSKMDLMTGSYAVANSVYVSGSDIYAATYYFAGSGAPVGALWTSLGGGSFVENELTDAGHGSLALSVYVDVH